jgi:hypothetical protein
MKGENNLASFGDLAAVSLTVIANRSLRKLESETREPDCIVSNTFCTGCNQRTFVFRKFADQSFRRKKG